MYAGVFGVGLDELVVVPVKKEPPDLVIMPPMGAATVAIAPDPVLPPLAFSIIS
jgi:hypothetical protein